MPPESIMDAPQPEPVAAPYWVAFWRLSGCRFVIPTMGGVVDQPIQRGEMDAYLADAVEWETRAEREGFRRVIGTLDREWRELMAARREQERKVAQTGRPKAR